MLSRADATLRSLGRKLSPTVFPYGRFGAALLIGAVGAWLFARLNLPLPWMLGSMTACTLAALVPASVAAPAMVHPPTTVVIGLMLRTGFTLQVLKSIWTWAPTVLGLARFVVVSGAACLAYFSRIAGFDLAECAEIAQHFDIVPHSRCTVS